MVRHEAPEGPHLGPDWWAPLECLVRRVSDDPRRRFLAITDFSVELRVIRPPRPRVLVYRHRYTRRVLHLDAEGAAYRFIPYRDRSRGLGQYRRHWSVDDALDALTLYELPWMKPGLEGERRGLAWEDRLILRRWLEAGRLDEDLSCLICRDRRRDERRTIGDEGWILHALDDEELLRTGDSTPRPALGPLGDRPDLRVVAGGLHATEEDDDDDWGGEPYGSIR